MLCLSLNGSATPLDSNLSHLIFGIMSCLTDLNPLLCIPDASSISGSVEHRFQDQRTSHSSTLSILWTITSYLSVFTSYFTPENLTKCLGSYNYNLSFQTCFTYISTMYSLMINRDHQNASRAYHLHVKCKRCLRPVYEGHLEIDDSQGIVEQLQRQRDTTNQYWVDSHHLQWGMKMDLEPYLEGVEWKMTADPMEALHRTDLPF